VVSLPSSRRRPGTAAPRAWLRVLQELPGVRRCRHRL